MRTSVRIDGDLHRALKEQAVRSGRTIGAVLDDAVRIGLERMARVDTTRYKVAASGAGGLLPGIDLASNASVRAAMESEESVSGQRLHP